MKILNANILMENAHFDPLPRDRKPFFKILPGFRHRSDQIYHIWKSPLGDPLIILPSIYYKSVVYVCPNHTHNDDVVDCCKHPQTFLDELMDIFTSIFLSRDTYSRHTNTC